jgi:Flp pilus assembly protein TadG
VIRWRGRSTSSRGQALLELALVAPILLLLFMGTVDVARLLFASVALEEATQEGALYAAYSPFPSGPIQTRVTSSSNADEVSGATVTVVCATTPAPGTVTVSSQYPYPLITPWISDLLGNTVTIRARVIATNIKGTCS